MPLKQIVLGIDASRCRSGGSINHLKGILNNIVPAAYEIKLIHLWAYKELLEGIPDYSWLVKHTTPALEKPLLFQLLWQMFFLSKELKKNNCNILFTADASTLCGFRSQVVLSQDLLSYEPGVSEYFGWGKSRLRLSLIRILQNRAFRSAKGVIFLTNYTASLIQKSCGLLNKTVVIPHGFNIEFITTRSEHRPNTYHNDPITCIYISNTEMYKHQWTVVEAINKLNLNGYNIKLNLVGGGIGKAQKKLDLQILESDPEGSYVKKYDFLSQKEIQLMLKQTDIFVFASSCETFGITLLEGMASGLPIACSNRSSLPEVLRDGGLYFDPEDSNSISGAIETLINDPLLSNLLAEKAKTIAKEFSWKRCARETFAFISDCAK